jgi:hypothetical protein
MRFRTFGVSRVRETALRWFAVTRLSKRPKQDRCVCWLGALTRILHGMRFGRHTTFRSTHPQVGAMYFSSRCWLLVRKTWTPAFTTASKKFLPVVARSQHSLANRRRPGLVYARVGRSLLPPRDPHSFARRLPCPNCLLSVEGRRRDHPRRLSRALPSCPELDPTSPAKYGDTCCLFFFKGDSKSSSVVCCNLHVQAGLWCARHSNDMRSAGWIWYLLFRNTVFYSDDRHGQG